MKLSTAAFWALLVYSGLHGANAQQKKEDANLAAQFPASLKLYLELSDAQVKHAIAITTRKVDSAEERSEVLHSESKQSSGEIEKGQRSAEPQEDRVRVQQKLVALLSPEQRKTLAALASTGTPDDIAQEATLYGFIPKPSTDYDKAQRFGGNVPRKDAAGQVVPEKSKEVKKGKRPIPPIR